MNMDDLIREKRMRGGNLPGLLCLYAALLGLMVFAAMSIS